MAILSLLSCENDPNKQPDISQEEVGTVVIDNTNIEWLTKVDRPVTIRKFVVPKEAASITGTFFTGYFPIDDNLLLADRYSSGVSCINSAGNIIWTLIPPSPGVDRYDNLGAIDIDYNAREIYVEDRQIPKLDIFSFSGTYKRSLTPPLPFMDFEVLGPDHIIYDIAQISQQDFLEEGKFKRYLLQRKEEVTLFRPLDPNFDLDAVAHNGYNRFRTVGEQLFHRQPFEEENYLLDGMNVTIDAKTSFAVNSQFAEVGLNKAININALFLFEEEIPYPTDVLYDGKSGNGHIIYKVGRDVFFTAFEDKKQEVFPSYYYDFGGEVLPGPHYYQDNRFYIQIPRKVYDYLQSSYAAGEFSKKEGLSKIKDIIDKSGDYDDIVVVSIEFE